MDEGDRQRCERLAQAVEEWGPVKDLVNALRERDVRGANLTSTYNYMNARTAPSIDFLAEAAGVVGVQRDWLLFGEGFMTEAEEATQAFRESVDQFGLLTGVYSVAVSGLLVDCVIRLLLAAPTGLSEAKDSQEQLAEGELPAVYGEVESLLVGLAAYPVLLFHRGTDPKTDPDPDSEGAREAFRAMLHAFSLAIPPERQGRPIDDILSQFEEDNREGLINEAVQAASIIPGLRKEVADE